MKQIMISFFLCLLVAVANGQTNSYYQQKTDFKIQVRLDDKEHMLHGNVSIDYTNNSPDELDRIYFHIWPNAYKNNHTKLAQQRYRFPGKSIDLTKKSLQGYIDSLAFFVNGTKAEHIIDSQQIDICHVPLPKPLKSGETIKITTPFRIKIPYGSISRFGHIGKKYKITQWFPKPAVYDKNGWHTMSYINMGEFYYEYGSYDVSITLPKDYVVAATGNLQTNSELDWLNKLARSTKQQNGLVKKRPEHPVKSKQKTIRYTEENIHDFAWFADKDYLVLKDTTITPNAKKKVTCWSFFRAKGYKKWKHAPGYICDALKYYSKWYGDYPYHHCTAIQNPPGSRGGGMEYPTITAIGHQQNKFLLELVIMHEVGHNWFQGMLGFNERDHPWLDEGINTFSEIRYMEEKYNSNNIVALGMHKMLAIAAGVKKLSYRQFHQSMYINNARQNLDQPASLASEKFRNGNYSAMAYSKAGASFYMLMKYLGEDEFNTIMKSFFATWQYKHPQPDDLKSHFIKNASKDVHWFFDIAIDSNQKADYKICKVKDGKALIKNKQNGAMPFPLSGIRANKELYTKWYDGFIGEKWVDLPQKDVDEYFIDYKLNTIDMNASNHRLKSNGLFQRIEPLSLNLVGALEQPHYTNINIVPAIGYNYYNTTMIGLYFRSNFFPKSKFNYHLVPMIGLENKEFAGEGKLSYNFYTPENKIRNTQLEVSGKQYAISRNSGEHFQRVKASANFRLKRKGTHNRIYQKFRLSTVYATDIHTILTNPNTLKYKAFADVRYFYSNYEYYHPLNSSIGLEFSDNFIKSSFVCNYKLRAFSTYRNSINFRIFGGAFFMKDNVQVPFLWHTNGSVGVQDYTFDNTFLGRFETPGDAGRQPMLSQQFAMDQGGFATPSPFGITDEWLLSLNVTSPIPYVLNKIPVKMYGNIATYGQTLEILENNDDHFLWEAGILVSIGDILNVYFPALLAEPLRKYCKDTNKNYWQNIRFTIDLNRLANAVQ